jgi:hypothetical protein
MPVRSYYGRLRKRYQAEHSAVRNQRRMRQLDPGRAAPTAISFVASSTAKNDTGASTLVVSLPGGVEDGDLLLLLVAQNNATTTLSALSGWTDLPGITWPLDSSTSRMWARYRFASGEPLSYTLDWGAGTPKGIGTIIAYRGVDGTTPFDINPVGASESVSQATHTTGNLTTVTDQAWLVSFFADRAGTSGTWTEPSGDTERVDITVTGTSQDSCEINDTNAGVTIGMYSKAATSTVATANATMLLIALRPTSMGGGSTNAPAENASGTGAALDAQATIAPNAENAAGTGIAQDPTPGVSANAENAAGTGAAFDATVSTTSGTNAPAEVASGTGAAQDPTVTIAPNAENASGTGTAQDATGGIGAQADAASGTGTAQDPLAAISANAENAAGTGQALDPTVVVGIFAPAENATGTGAALDASVIIAPAAQNATGTGTANDATVLTGTLAQAENAAGTGATPDPTIAVAANAENAAGTGAANNATVAFGKDAPADIATGTGAALDPTVRISPAAENAAGTGQALDVTVVFELIVIYATGAATLQPVTIGAVTAAAATGTVTLQSAATGKATTQ